MLQQIFARQRKSDRTLAGRQFVQLLLLTIVSGLFLGIVNQIVRDLQLASDALLYMSLLVFILALPWFLARKLGKDPIVVGLLSAAFLVSAVVSHYGYYIATLLLGLGNQGAYLDLGEPGSYRMLWQLFRNSMLQWFILAGLGGFVIGWLCSLLARIIKGRSSLYPSQV
jgi:hypothetical protein